MIQHSYPDFVQHYFRMRFKNNPNEIRNRKVESVNCLLDCRRCHNWFMLYAATPRLTSFNK